VNVNLCDREAELLEALGRGFIGAELEEHLVACENCGELRLVAGALLDERVEAIREAAVPSAEAMWCRIQLRQREAAQRAARRSLLIGQAATLAFASTLIAVFFGTDVAAGVTDAVASISFTTPLLLVIAAGLLLAPIAGYAVAHEK
jgi:predicted anti-sigma-YlaC factor YlaD